MTTTCPKCDSSYTHEVLEDKRISQERKCAACGEPYPLHPDVGPYRVIKFLGKGGMATVYLARVEPSEELVALKFPHRERLEDEEFVRRFRREVRAVSRVSHPNVCPILGFAEHDGDVSPRGVVEKIPYIIMKYISGGNLAERIKRGPRFTVEQAVALTYQIAEAMDAAHSSPYRVHHRDLKPANVLLDEAGRPYVTDFGMARIATDETTRLTSTGEAFGTPAYMAPEQFEVTRETDGALLDVYSLGVTFFELLTGRLPYEGNINQILYQLKNLDLIPKPSDRDAEVPAEIDRVCLRAMDRDSTKRYESMTAFRDVLRAYLGASATSLMHWPKRPDVEGSTATDIETVYTDDRACTLPAKDSFVNSIGMEFALIPAGTFLMGSDNGRSDEKPMHEVTITRPFYLGVTPVTQRQYEAVIKSNPSHFKSRPDNPVESLSWYDAVNFCNALSALEKRTSCYRITGEDVVILEGGTGYRLPTEAEWEYACRAGSDGEYCFGNDVARLMDYAWFGENSGGSTQSVKQKLANGFGLHDMHGNVWEWCWDGYDSGYYAKSVGSSAPRGPSQAEGRVDRGGSWDFTAVFARSASRGWSTPVNRFSDLGFRVARVQSDPP